ncbi:hypothetical protein Lal_00023228 [Lupinus albus]|nr:hypothetical protein Lal_00023228 [Lupinus albus]
MTTAINSNSSNGVLSPAAQSPVGLKTYFKTPEGRYKLQYEKTHPSSLLHYAHGKPLLRKSHHLQLQLHRHLQVLVPAAARLLGGSNGSRALSFVGVNGSTSKTNGGTTRIVSMGASTSSSPMANSNFDGKGTYLIFNVGDAIFISDLNSQDKDAKDGHDLLIGLSSGDVYSVSLRQQLQDVVVVLVLLGCQENKDGVGDSSFPVVKDQSQFSVAHARYSKSNPTARWHICQVSINSISFSSGGAYLATVGRDESNNICLLKYIQVTYECLITQKSYLYVVRKVIMGLCYVVLGGEDDLVQVWSMEDRKVVAWGEGHNSWVSGVAFDSYWSSPNASDNGETLMYRFGSVGQTIFKNKLLFLLCSCRCWLIARIVETKIFVWSGYTILLWDLEMDEIVVPLRRPPGVSPTYNTGSQSSHWDSAIPFGTLQPAPSMRDVPKISPLVAHHVHTESLTGLIFTQEYVLTACREGHIKVCMRPGVAESQSSNSQTLLATSLKEKPTLSSKINNSIYK